MVGVIFRRKVYVRESVCVFDMGVVLNVSVYVHILIKHFPSLLQRRNTDKVETLFLLHVYCKTRNLK